jgi:hypothetical protein
MFPSFKSSPLNPPRYKLVFNGIKQQLQPVQPVIPVVKPEIKVPPNANAIHYFLTK